MKNLRAGIPALFGLTLLLAIGLMSGCSAKRTITLWGDPQTGLILQYRLPEGQTLKYEISGRQAESTEVMGQKIDVESKVESTYSLRSMGKKDGNLQLEISIEAMNIQTKSPQGELSPDLSPVIGKSFVMTLSSLGEEIDLSGAESIEYNGPAGKRNLASRFQTVFPDTAARPVKVGDSWTTQDAIVEKGEGGTITIRFHNVHTLEGFETVGGFECARVQAKVSGDVAGDGNQGGATYTVKGRYQGVDTWYFAYKKGILVKLLSSGVIDATVDVTSPQNMTIPTKQELESEITLIK
jgi:hypothetical protein